MAKGDSNTKRTVKSVTPPGEGGGDDGGAQGGSGARASAPRRPGRPTQYDKLQGDLEELFGTLALVQGGMTLLTEDPRHEVASEVTLQYAPPLAEAWTDLARQDPRVFKVLKRLTTGSAWGGVVMTTGGFLLAQFNAYGMMESPFAPPAGFPAGDSSDPRTNGVPTVPPVPSPEPTARDPRNSAPDGGVTRDAAQNPAEQQRRAVEARRQQRGS